MDSQPRAAAASHCSEATSERKAVRRRSSGAPPAASSAAEASLATCRTLDASLEALRDLYAERIDYYREIPPGPDWDGVFVAETK